jgi:hypothetical protein
VQKVHIPSPKLIQSKVSAVCVDIYYINTRTRYPGHTGFFVCVMVGRFGYG